MPEKRPAAASGILPTRQAHRHPFYRAAGKRGLQVNI